MIKAVLTIDDISSKNTPQIVDYLVENGIKAVMFGWGENMEKLPKEAEYALKKGMIVGNHSYTHPHFSELSFEECVEEIEKCEAVLDKLYERVGVERKYRPFRFPYGDKGGENKETLQKYFKEKGFDKLDDTNIPFAAWKEMGLDKDIDTFWTFDFGEYCIRKGSDFTMDNVMQMIHYVDPESGAGLLVDGTEHLLIIHAHDETEELVPNYYKQILGYVMEKGVEFIEPKFL